jgi:hypothetical protein
MTKRSWGAKVETVKSGGVEGVAAAALELRHANANTAQWSNAAGRIENST